MALKNEIDESRIRERLSQWFAGVLKEATQPKVTNLRVPQESGLSSLTLLFDLEWLQEAERIKRKLVARCVPRTGGVFETCDLRREFELFRVLSHLPEAPVPTPFDIEVDDDSILGAPFFVMERVEGRVASDDPPYTVEGWVNDMSPAQRAKLSDNALKALVSVHDIDVEKHHLNWLDDGGMSAPDLATKLMGQRRYFRWASAGEPNPIIAKGFDWLEEHMPVESSDIVISWGDARLGNLIIAEDLSVAAIIDWEMAGLGAREIDLGWWLLTRRFHTSAIGVELPEGLPSEEDVVKRYTELSGYVPQHLDYYIIFAALRLSIIFVRLGNMMIEKGMLPPDASMPYNNPVLQMLSDLLGLGPIEGQAQYFVGNR